jgi:hypothetical protein
MSGDQHDPSSEAEGEPSPGWQGDLSALLQSYLRRVSLTEEGPDPAEEIVASTDDHIDICVGVAQWKTRDGFYVLEEDFVVSGEIWRVHKNDPDPYPSKPHAHCIAGARRFVGCKLHLGTAQLYRGREAQARYLDPKQFNRLIELIRPKFPDISLPLLG